MIEMTEYPILEPCSYVSNADVVQYLQDSNSSTNISPKMTTPSHRRFMTPIRRKGRDLKCTLGPSEYTRSIPRHLELIMFDKETNSLAWELRQENRVLSNCRSSMDRTRIDFIHMTMCD